MSEDLLKVLCHVCDQPLAQRPTGVSYCPECEKRQEKRKMAELGLLDDPSGCHDSED